MACKRIVQGILALSIAAIIALVGMKLSLSPVHADDESAAQVAMLSDSQGVNFDEYLRGVYLSVKKSWFQNMPATVSFGNQGINAVEFRILQNGSVPQDFVKIVLKSEKSDLDAASLRAVRTASFSHLPEKYSQPFIVLRFTFYYNSKPPKQ
ncbi:MAG TPA: energy transducer TonB [Dongiaceae bacterium]|nr:energy transducer TonB [Dongiaceae bacterium]